MAGSLRQVGENVWELRVFLGRDANERVCHRMNFPCRAARDGALSTCNRFGARGDR
jgi:hypothetical protein